MWDTIKKQFNLTMDNLRKMNAFKWLILLVVVLFIFLLFLGFENILSEKPNSTGQIYKAIGFGMIMIWVCIFICYFIWAVFFYNVNKGMNAEKRKRVEEAKLNKAQGKPYRLEDAEESQENPYKDETFGFPRGTVRGMIAFTLLYGALALLIVSFGMKGELQNNNLFANEIDFFKKAFLMMIAFYFGTHSLKYIYPDKSGNSDTTNQPENSSNSGVTNQPFVEPQKPEIVVLPSKDEVIPKIKVDDKEIPPIQATDPMSPKK